MTRLTGTDIGRRQVRKLSDCHVASLIALTLGFVAHYHYGLPRLAIRTSALTGAAIFALIFALLLATEWIEKKKSKRPAGTFSCCRGNLAADVSQAIRHLARRAARE